MIIALALAMVVLLAGLLSDSAHGAGPGMGRAGSVLFGSLLGILTTLVTARSVIRSSDAVAGNPHFGMLPVYSGLLMKLIVVAGGTYLGLVYLGLGPLYVVLGYLAMQAGYIWVSCKPASRVKG